MESFLKGYRWEEQKRKKENLDADCSGLCSFGANGSSAESAWILSLQGFALWLRPTRNGSESLVVQARNVKKNWSFLFFKWKWILLGNGSKFWKIKNWPQQNREKRSPGWNCDHLHKIGEIGLTNRPPNHNSGLLSVGARNELETINKLINGSGKRNEIGI